MTRAPGLCITLALDRVAFLPANRVTDNAAILTLKSLVFEPLCRWSAGHVHPGLFDRWSCDPDGRHWEFHIRPEARFHDGVLCTADHILSFVDAILVSRDMFGMPWSYARYFAGARFTAPSAEILSVETPAPLADLPEILAEFFISRADADGRPLIGTGRYRVASFIDGQEAVLDPVSSGPVIVAHQIPDAETRLDAVRSGTRERRIDIACGLEQMRGFPDFGDDLNWSRTTSTLSVMAYLNASEGPFRDPSLRRAANLAIDKTRIIRDVFGGLAEPAATVVSPFHFGFTRSNCVPIAHDPDAARRLVAAQGTLPCLRLRTPDHMPERAPALAAAIAECLDAAGFSVDIDLQPDRPEYAREVGAKRMGDIAVFDSSPHSTFRVLDDKISAISRGVWWQGFEDPETERLVAEARRTLPEDARASVYGRCLARLNAAPPWLYLLHPTLVCAARHGVGPVTLDHRGIVALGTIGRETP